MSDHNEKDTVFSDWRSIKGTELSMEQFQEYCNNPNITEIFIGTDSQVRGTKTKFVTVVAAYEPGNGGRAIARSAKVENLPDLRTRLLQETWFSIDLALKLSKELDQRITIHCDVNSNPIYKSGQYKNEVQGYVKGFGFDCQIKPNAWAASCVADGLTK
jgi:predicted RNase H-related nuclease YkuK (DUF458 family)